MIHYKEVNVQTKAISHTTCDKCRKTIKMDGYYDGFKSKFETSAGDIYPEGNFTEIRRLDLCQSCAEIAIKLLSENGFNFNEIDGDHETSTYRIKPTPSPPS